MCYDAILNALWDISLDSYTYICLNQEKLNDHLLYSHEVFTVHGIITRTFEMVANVLQRKYKHWALTLLPTQ